MFIKYQKVRNAVVGTTTAVVGGIAAFFGLAGDDPKPTQRDNSHAVAAIDSHVDGMPAPVSRPPTPPPVSAESTDFGLHVDSAPVVIESVPRTESAKRRRSDPPTKEQMYLAAMTFANASAPSNGKGKDVLGASNPWKLNLYDDDKDGQWDRGKLDTNRDDIDDEKWNFKEGRWEKDGGQMVWGGNRWDRNTKSASNRNAAVAKRVSPADTKTTRYAKAMKIALSAASPTGKGKDVLGPSSPWKLNLYDDDKNGQWDRGKLDTNRDDIDDEKWNFKNGRWEKDAGAMIWSGSGWTKPSRANANVASNKTPAASRDLVLYRRAMKIATRRATSKKGKDVLGSSSPWKLNLYDDNADGQWDRGKLDTNRDEVDDEKWNFKKGRWEKDGGATLWKGSDWGPSGK